MLEHQYILFTSYDFTSEDMYIGLREHSQPTSAPRLLPRTHHEEVVLIGPHVEDLQSGTSATRLTVFELTTTDPFLPTTFTTPAKDVPCPELRQPVRGYTAAPRR